MSASMGQIDAWMGELEEKMLDNWVAAENLKRELRQAEWYLGEGSDQLTNHERIEVMEEVHTYRDELEELAWKYESYLETWERLYSQYDSYLHTWDRLDSLYQDYLKEQA